MNTRSRDRNRLYFFSALPILLIMFGWYTVYSQSRSIEESSIKTYQDAQLDIVENAARAASIYIAGELERRGTQALPDIEVEVLNNFVKPIKIGDVGDAWIYAPDHVVFDQSPDFPKEYIGKNMKEIFEIQKAKGAWHYEEMADAVVAGRGGTGWYVWEPGKKADAAPWWEFLTQDAGREIASWTPVKVFPNTEKELIWVIGMSSMLPEIMQINGAYNQIHTSIMTMLLATLVVVFVLARLLRAETQVQELLQQVQELRIEIDEAKKAKQVSEIVETEYFQDLTARARAMRERKRTVSSE